MNFSENIIAATKNDEEFLAALESECNIIFDLAPNIHTMMGKIKKAKEKYKKLYIHIDLAEGIGKDRAGILFLKKCGVDGIISTRTNLIRAAKEEGLMTVQRFFIVDSHSVDTTYETAKNSKADMIEIMPALVYKVIKKLKEKISVPIIAGGLTESREEAETAIKSGAKMVSTSQKELWR